MGALAPAVGAADPLADVPAAVRHLASGRAQGEIAVTV